MGRPENISISGTVENKVDNRSKEEDTYSIQVVSKNGASYNIFVSDQVYKMHNFYDRVTVKAQKGLLGIVYNEEVY